MELGGKFYVVHGSRSDRFRLHFLADTHVGATNCAMKRVRADIYLMGHLHERIAHRRTQVSADADCKDLCDHVQIGCITGSYLLTYAKGHAGYGEEKQYDPVATGCASVEIRPATRELKAEV